MANAGAVGAGVVLLGLAVIGFIIPLNDMGWSAPQIHDICSSGLGQIGQAFSGDVQKVCSEFKYVTYGIYGFGLIGIILLIVGSVVPSSSKALTCKSCNFVAMSDSELLKHNSDNHIL